MRLQNFTEWNRRISPNEISEFHGMVSVEKYLSAFGAGRIGKLRMRAMSLYESGESSGEVSLEALCNGELTGALTGVVSKTAGEVQPLYMDLQIAPHF